MSFINSLLIEINDNNLFYYFSNIIETLISCGTIKFSSIDQQNHYFSLSMIVYYCK